MDDKWQPCALLCLLLENNKGLSHETWSMFTSRREKLQMIISFRLVGCFGFSGPLSQYFSLYGAASQRGGERGEKG